MVMLFVALDGDSGPSNAMYGPLEIGKEYGFRVEGYCNGANIAFGGRNWRWVSIGGSAVFGGWDWRLVSLGGAPSTHQDGDPYYGTLILFWPGLAVMQNESVPDEGVYDLWYVVDSWFAFDSHYYDFSMRPVCSTDKGGSRGIWVKEPGSPW